MRLPPAARAAANDGRREESGPHRRSLIPNASEFVDYAEAKTEDTTTSQRPMDAYEKWLSERFAEAEDDEQTTAAEAEPPVRRQSGVRNREPAQRDPYRDAMPTAVEVEMDDAPPTMDGREPWDVPVAHDSYDREPQYEQPRDFDTDREPEYDEPRDDDYASNDEPHDQPRGYESGETRMGAPRTPAHKSSSAGVYGEKIPPAPAMPRLATPFGGFPQQRAYVQQSAQQNAQMPSYERPAPAPAQQPYAMQAMHAPSMQPMQMHAMQRAMHPQSAVATTPPSRPFQPLLTQVVTNGSQAKEIHRAPWFCLGLAVGVVSMVVAFFLPTRAEPVAAAPLPTMQINPPAPQQPQVGTQPPVMAPQQMAPQQMMPQQMTPQQQPTQPSQGIAPAPLPPATQAVAPTPPPQGATASRPLPTVDVRSLPVAGKKAQAPAPAAPRRQYSRPQAPRRPAAPPPKPMPQDDDDDLSSEKTPQAAPKAAPAPAQENNALAPDTLLQAL